MSQSCLIIPGFGEDVHDDTYTQIQNRLREKDITPIPVKIGWKYRTMSHWLEDFFQQYETTYTEDSSIYGLGFSFGAFILLCSSQYISFETLILCSLSPLFAEDLEKAPPKDYTNLLNTWGKRRLNDFSNNFSISDLPYHPAHTIHLLYGYQEIDLIKHRAQDTSTRFQNTELTEIPEADHNISHPLYYQMIEELISKL